MPNNEDAPKEAASASPPAGRSTDAVLKIVDQPYVVGLTVNDGTNVVTVGTNPTSVPAELVDAVYAAAADANILLVEEVSST
jgi:hypothetical protein